VRSAVVWVGLPDPGETRLVVLARNVGAPLRYELEVEDVIWPEAYQDQPGALQAITQRLTTALERGIRKAPAQYFWLHRRWKHQPAKPKRPATVKQGQAVE
jgi:KDO2-lipid IV(A) lauroyltransferase